MARKHTAIKWTKEIAASEFSINPRTLTNRLRAAGIEPDKSGRFTTKQICDAVFGGIDEEKLRLTREQADKLAMENSARRGELVEVKSVAEAINRAIGSIRSYILGLTFLPEEDRDEILLKCKALYESAFNNSGGDESDMEPATPADCQPVGR